MFNTCEIAILVPCGARLNANQVAVKHGTMLRWTSKSDIKSDGGNRHQRLFNTVLISYKLLSS
jgi:hypothetical protein